LSVLSVLSQNSSPPNTFCETKLLSFQKQDLNIEMVTTLHKNDRNQLSKSITFVI